MTVSDSFHSPVLIGTLIFTASCNFLLLSCLLRWCDFTFCLSKYQREISCKQGDMTFLLAEFKMHAQLFALESIDRLDKIDKWYITPVFAPGGSHALYSLSQDVRVHHWCCIGPDPSVFQ